MRRVCTRRYQTGRPQIEIEFNRDVWSVLRNLPPGSCGHRTMYLHTQGTALNTAGRTYQATRRHETEPVILIGHRGGRDEDGFRIRPGSSAQANVYMCPRGPTPTRACKRSAKSGGSFLAGKHRLRIAQTSSLRRQR